MPAYRRIVLLRHGETTSNVAQLLDTSLPGALLTRRGEEQARQVGAELAQEFTFGKIICSYAVRAGQTAVLATQAYEQARGFTSGSVPLNAVDGLKEVDMGTYDMRSDEEAHRLYHQNLAGWLSSDAEARFPDGENYADVLARFQPVLEQLAVDDSFTGDVLVVAHGGVIRIATTFAAAVPRDFALENRLPNCRYMVLEPGREPFGSWKLKRWGEHVY